MYRLAISIAGVVGTLFYSGAALSQPEHWTTRAFGPIAPVATAPTAPEQASPERVSIQSDTYVQDPDAAFGAPIQFAAAFTPEPASPLAATSRRDIWIERGPYADRLTVEMAGELRRADGSPLPVALSQAASLDAADYSVRYIRGFPAARGLTPSGLEVSLTPHAGIGVSTRGGTAEAGATLRIGQGIGKLMPEGRDVFGDRSRWYLYAAGSGRAVGYNFARTRDGDYASSGYTQDRGIFLGDASIGLAYRRGDVHTSIGLSYRELSVDGIRNYDAFDNEVDEGMIAFQLSIRP